MGTVAPTTKMSNADTWNVGRRKSFDVEAAKWSLFERDPVVGAFDAHNVWPDYDEFLFKGVTTTGKMALDFACGPGRNIVKFATRFARIDGVDISAVNLEKAKLWLTSNGISIPMLYQNVGDNIAVVPSAAYDVVFATIAMQHICVHDIRQSLWRDFHRVLVRGGYLCFQMGYGPGHPVSVDYFENDYTNPDRGDTRVERVEDLEADLTAAGFSDITHDIRPVGPGDRHPNWIFVRCRRG